MKINTEELTPKDWAEIMGVTREIATTSYSYPESIVDFYNSFNIDDMDSSWYEVGNTDCTSDAVYRWHRKPTLVYLRNK